MTPESVSAVGEVLKQYMLPAGLIAAGIVLVVLLVVAVAGIFGLYGAGRAVRAAILWQPRPTLEELVTKIRNGATLNAAEYEYAIAFDADSFTLELCRAPVLPRSTARWEDVCRVIAFRRELFRCDCVCLRFALANGAGIEVNEAAKGWADLVEAMPGVLLGSVPAHAWKRADSLSTDPAEAMVVYEHIVPRTRAK